MNKIKILNIAIDASRTTVARITGTEQYAIALIRALIQHNEDHTQHHITLYFRDPPAPNLFPESPFVTHKVIPFKRIWTHLRFAYALWQDRPDVTFVPAHTLPFFFPNKAIVTIHDLGYKVFPEAHPAKNRRYLDWTTRYSAKRANIILADSHATAQDLTRYYGTAREKIRVVYPSVEKLPVHNVDLIREKYQLPKRYFIFIGTLQPRKNIARLVKAYAHYRAQIDNPAGLILAGGQGWLYDDKWVEGIEGVQLTGYFDEVDKGALYAGAIALVFPSLYEGFGFPVIEAMHAGTAVIASNTSSLPELVESAGLQVDPLNIESIATAMIKIDTDTALRDTLIEQGNAQVSKFTWEIAADKVFQTITNLINK